VEEMVGTHGTVMFPTYKIRCSIWSELTSIMRSDTNESDRHLGDLRGACINDRTFQIITCFLNEVQKP